MYAVSGLLQLCLCPDVQTGYCLDELLYGIPVLDDHVALGSQTSQILIEHYVLGYLRQRQDRHYRSVELE